MRLPTIRGVIDRRILINYRVDPDVLTTQLPPPFRSQIYEGWGIAGICLIRLRAIRPAGLPRWLGTSSENAAHRFAVEWDEAGAVRRGVYIPRRDTSSRLNAWAGGRVFPGEHHHSRFLVRETASHFEVGMESERGETRLAVIADLDTALPEASIFASLGKASAFFEKDCVGYSVTRDPHRFDGIELRCLGWRAEPLGVQTVRSSYFDDERHFPAGSIRLDHALLMRNIEHQWHQQPDLMANGSPSPAAAMV